MSAASSRAVRGTVLSTRSKMPNSAPPGRTWLRQRRKIRSSTCTAAVVIVAPHLCHFGGATSCAVQERLDTCYSKRKMKYEDSALRCRVEAPRTSHPFDDIRVGGFGNKYKSHVGSGTVPTPRPSGAKV